MMEHLLLDEKMVHENVKFLVKFFTTNANYSKEHYYRIYKFFSSQTLASEFHSLVEEFIEQGANKGIYQFTDGKSGKNRNFVNDTYGMFYSLLKTEDKTILGIAQISLEKHKSVYTIKCFYRMGEHFENVKELLDKLGREIGDIIYRTNYKNLAKKVVDPEAPKVLPKNVKFVIPGDKNEMRSSVGGMPHGPAFDKAFEFRGKDSVNSGDGTGLKVDGPQDLRLSKKLLGASHRSDFVDKGSYGDEYFRVILRDSKVVKFPDIVQIFTKNISRIYDDLVEIPDLQDLRLNTEDPSAMTEEKYVHHIF